MATDTAIDARAQLLLKTLVEKHISDGQPVGSTALVEASGLGISPATVRNIMAELEELGLVMSPHTSAGRVPTAQGYRFFVDTLMKVRPLDSDEVRELAGELKPDPDLQGLMRRASTLLSSVTRLTGMVMLPRRRQSSFRHIEFLPLSEKRILVIWVVNELEVQNRIIHLDHPCNPGELQQAANYLNERFAGQSMQAIRNTLLEELHSARESVNSFMVTAVEMAKQAFPGEAEQPGGDYVLEGGSNLMEYAEMADMEKLHDLFEAFERKHKILDLLDKAATAQGVQIFIGEESGYQVFDGCSFVTAPYSVSGETVGVLGIIGPTRLNYERVIPVVDVTAKLLGAALNSKE
ncbi:MAG TPA: heat-inducible transcription repressor HrcA [Gammaproteobacteria bacterium]|nr:heat-inducible transcription repressor HrcA [Gammaproteobacteria bacterium]